jgi:hypothetical protein
MNNKKLGILALSFGIAALALVYLANNKRQSPKSSLSPATIRVAILDTGLDSKQQNLFPNVAFLDGWNFFDDTSDVTDENSHGSQVTHFVLKNFLRLAPAEAKIEIIPIKIVKNEAGLSPESLAKAIHFALDKEAKLLQIAFGLTRNSPELKEAIQRAVQAQALIVTAAGHGLENPYRPMPLASLYPQAYRETLVVGASRSPEQHDPLSNFGPELDIVLLYEEQSGDHHHASSSPNPNNAAAETAAESYENLKQEPYGSSFAAAQLSGNLAALLSVQNKPPTIGEVREWLSKSSTRLGDGPRIFSESLWLKLFE